MSSERKKLYLAKSIKELKNKAETKDLNKNSPRVLKKSAINLFREAKTANLQGDEEKSFILFMRVCEICQIIKTSKANDSKEILEAVKNEFIEALKTAEILHKSLDSRYQVEFTASPKIEYPRESREIKEIYKNGPLSLKPIVSPVAATKPVIETSISAISLYNLMSDHNTSLVIMDTRDAEQYKESHMKHLSCINIPENILRPGITSMGIEKSLPINSVAKFQMKNQVDYVVLMDWNSSADNLKENTPLHALKEAICKWDQDQYLKSEPLILEKGYEHWVLSYPTETTNSSAVRKRNSFEQTKLSNGVMASLDVSYPDFDNFDLETVIQPDVIPNGVDNLAIPRVDRSKKPVLSERSMSQEENIPRISPKIAWTENNDDSRKMVDSILESETTLVNTELDHAKKVLKKEKEFEDLCRLREKEADQTMIEQLQIREEELLSQIQHFHDEKVEYEQNSKQLEKENAMLKQKLGNNYLTKEDSLVQKHNKRKQEEKMRLDAEIERLRKERKLKEKEQVEKKSQQNILKPPAPHTIVDNSPTIPYITPPVPTVTPTIPYITPAVPTVTSTIPYITPTLTPIIPQSKPPTAVKSQSTVKRDNEYTMRLKEESNEPKKGLSRSHSSPNINKLFEDEDSSNKKSTTPVFNRNIKPRTLAVNRSNKPEIRLPRHRDFHPVYSSIGQAQTGLKNFGNTCFMNSVIQCLYSTIPLSSYLISKEYERDINKSNRDGTKGDIIVEFSAVIELMSRGDVRYFTPVDFKNTVSRHLPICVGYEQQDAHEFLTYLLEKLHADVNRASCINLKRAPPDIEKESSLKASNIFWEWHLGHNDSMFTQLFEGVMQSKLTCMFCRTESNNYEVFSCMSLPISPQNQCNLEDCIQSLLKAEQISGEAAWDCPNCKTKRDAEKRMVICRLPKILIIHLKRFYYKGLWRQKLQNFVDFPSKLNMERYLMFKDPDNSVYFNYGVVNHYGTMEGGHYISYCKQSDKWFKCDDQDVSEMKPNAVKTSAAYILFYSSINF